jgi:16S rRNA processing protein RimM
VTVPPAGDTYYVRNQAVIVPKGYLAVGQIVGVHGLRGELKVESYSDNPERFAAGVTLFLGEALEQVTVETMRPHKTNLLVKLAGIAGREEADGVRGLWFFVPEAEAAALDEGEYWIHDIIGLTVVGDDGRVLGKIVDVLATGSNDVYVVRPEANQAEGGRTRRDLLIPAIADVVESVDLAAGELHIRLVEGLLDE